ncbi:MAG TPA: ATP-binding protein [Burkholderiales bacterium]
MAWVPPRRQVAIAGIAGALGLLWLIAIASYQSIVGFEDRMRWVARSHDILVNIEEMSASYARTRGSWYGYMAAGDQRRLDAFYVSSERVREQIERVKALIEEPSRRVRLLALEQLVRADLSRLAELAALRVEDGAPNDENDVFDTLRASADHIRELQSGLVEEQRGILQERREESEAAGTFIRATIAFGYSACLLVLMISLLYFHREAQARIRAQARVMDLNRVLNERADALQAINKELEDFSYSVSHDLRGPIRAISSFTQILEQEYGLALDAEGLRLLGVVRGNAERMGSLIDDLLAFSRVGRQSMSPSPIEMTALVDEVIASLRVDSRDAVRAHIDIEKLPDAVGDRALLSQVWSNLIDNALKYSSKVERPMIRIAGNSDNDWTVYTIEDNGPGFDMQYVDKLFEVFQRLHHARDFPGTGVGLAIVKRIIDRHEGRVRAEGKLGEGARFMFALPIRGGANDG